MAALYKRLASLKTSVYLLGLLSFFYVLGTIFPQGASFDEYISGGGKYAGAVRAFSLLDIFATPWFLAAAFVLFLNLSVCLYERFFKIMRRKKRWLGASPDFEVPVLLEKIEADEALAVILKRRLGFRPLFRDERWTVFEKGLYYRWLTWLYHAAILAAIVGFVLSGLFVREGMLALKPSLPTELAAPEKKGWIAEEKSPEFKIALTGFSTEYLESPQLGYPKDKLARFAVAAGWKGISYTLKEDDLVPRDWFAGLRITKNTLTLAEKTIEVNDPLKFEGYTFYLVGYEQTLKLRVGGKPIDTKAFETAELPGVGKTRFGELKRGKVFTIDGGIKETAPFVIVTPEKSGAPLKLEINKDAAANGVRLALVGFEESVVLSYRYDPGVPVLWLAGSFVFIVMTLRCFGRWYLLGYAVERGRIVFSIRAKGLLADPDRIKNAIKRHLSIER